MKSRIFDVCICFRLVISINLSKFVTTCISKMLHQLMSFSVTVSPDLSEYFSSFTSLVLCVNNTNLSVTRP